MVMPVHHLRFEIEFLSVRNNPKTQFSEVGARVSDVTTIEHHLMSALFKG